MSYMRGKHYVWSSEHFIHLWLADGKDAWEETSWGESWKEGADGGEPAAVSVPVEVFDRIVAMRAAQLMKERRFLHAVQEALSTDEGNGGCLALMELKEEIKGLFKESTVLG